MCIVLLTTAHPDYALIVLDNRDEFILRATSRPHWWSHDSSTQEILSARDLQRAEQGTWMGITRSGNFAVLTNYKEEDTKDNSTTGQRSRGGMVTAWLSADPAEETSDFVRRMLSGDGVKGVGGFSLLCGRLRPRGGTMTAIQSLAVISNRAENLEDVPWITGQKGEIHGLSNTTFNDPSWPKVRMGKEMLSNVIGKGSSKEQLIKELFDILDNDTLPPKSQEETFSEYTYHLRKSIFIPAFGSSDSHQAPKADAVATAEPSKIDENASAMPSPLYPGVYGTQRQTILLVDWDGNVTFIERALFDEKGLVVPKGEGDIEIGFQIDGWSEAAD